MGAPYLGDTTAPVIAVLYSDFHCPFCRKFAEEILPQLRLLFIRTGDLGLVFKHLPLENLHPNAPLAAAVAVCADRGGRFWEMHDFLYAAPQDYAQESLRALAASVGLGGEELVSCMQRSPDDVVLRDMSEARALGVSQTPALLLGLRVGEDHVKGETFVFGAKPLEEFVVAIDTILSRR
jgi:protein-disulfide isomerase